MSNVLKIVEETKAIRWWIDDQIAKGRSNEEIEECLPAAVEFITGRLTFGQLLAATREP